MKRWRIGLLGVAVSLLAIYFIVREIRPEQFWQALTEANYGYVLPSAALLVAGLVTRAFRWQLLLGHSLPLRRTFSIMNVAYLVNGVLPLRIGEVARIFLATRANPPVPPFKTASTIIVERLLDLLAVVLMVMVGVAAGPVPEVLRTAAAAGGVAVLVGFIVLVGLSWRRDWLHALMRFVIRGEGLRARLEPWVDHFLDGLKPLTQVRMLTGVLGWTALSWGISIAAGYILMFTFFDQASLSATLLYIAAAAFAIAVPAMLVNAGPYEAAIIVAISALGFGEPPERALAFAVLVHGLNLFVHAGTGVVGFLQEGISVSQLSQGVNEMRRGTVGTQDA